MSVSDPEERDARGFTKEEREKGAVGPSFLRFIGACILFMVTLTIYTSVIDSWPRQPLHTGRFTVVSTRETFLRFNRCEIDFNGDGIEKPVVHQLGSCNGFAKGQTYTLLVEKRPVYGWPFIDLQVSYSIIR